ncbi:MAG: cupin domain-containing protein [Candidatus Cybelea sp.]
MNFKVLATQDGVQAAVMRLAQREASGQHGNEHAASVQVLVVVRGQVDAEAGKTPFRMLPGDSTIVARGIERRFVAASSEEAVTINVHAPPAYDDG